MSRTHKPKPPDKAESAPKPSRKVAIEEVLRSLQDLVNNELAVGEPQPGMPTPTDTALAAPAPETEIPIAVAAAPAPIDAAAGTDASIDLLAELPENVPAATAAPEPAPIVKTPAPPEGLQQDLPFLEPEPVPAVAAPVATALELSSLLVEPDYPSPELPGTDELPADRSRPGNEPVGLPDAPFPNLPADPVPDLEMHARVELTDSAEDTDSNPALADTVDLNDIPVLEDAVDLAEEPEPPATLDESSPSAAALPAAQDGRRLAIQVAARLNVELRKAGQPGLSSDIIARLAHLLEETLAKGAANMENSAKTKH